MRKVHAALEEKKQYRGDEKYLLSLFLHYLVNLTTYRVNSNHNRAVTDKIVEHVMSGKDYSSKDEIACKCIPFLIVHATTHIA